MFEEVLTISLQTEAQFPTAGFKDVSAVTDEHLVAAVLDGDETAFTEIFERYKRPMTRVISRFFRERNDIEDFVQQCFTKSYFSLNKFRGGEDRSFHAWLTRIAVNICYDEFRRRARRTESLFTEMSDDESDYLDSVADGRASPPDASLAASQLAERVLSSLEAKDRIAMTLVYSEDYSLNEAADAIGITTSNLKSRLFRCRNQIRIRFGYLFR